MMRMVWRIIRGTWFYIFLLAAATVLVEMGLYAWQLRPFDTHPRVDLISGGLGALLGGLLTLLLAWVAWLQLGALSGTAQTDSQRASAGFILQLRADFFTPRTPVLFTLIDQGWLRYVRVGGNPEPHVMSFFRVDIEKVDAAGLDPWIRRQLTDQPAYTPYEVDDLLLGHFEDFAMLQRQNVVSKEMIYEMFSWYIERTWENDAIQAYVEDEQIEDPTIYEGTRRLYDLYKTGWKPKPRRHET